MHIFDLSTNARKPIIIELIDDQDFKGITKAKFWFDWSREKEHFIYKLHLTNANEILGLMSLELFEDENRIEIKLLAVLKDQRGKTKQYDGIGANLIAFACREALKFFGEQACVSLFPKTELKRHYIKKYGMHDAGRQLFLEGDALLKLLMKYNT